MKTTIHANNKDEARAIQIGMTDPAVRAFVIICGLLEQLPSQRARNRVLQYANDLASDPDLKHGKLSTEDARDVLPAAALATHHAGTSGE